MILSSKQITAFRTKLLQWHNQDNDRDLPWKGERNLYKIWLSEILLQQTRAEQGLPYYEKFIQHFPSIQDLANADDDLVFKLWQGLGYYNRCKNMLATARYISTELNCQFPTSYQEILALKGVGAYTAAAIASFGLHLPYPVVDGNVYRVLARVYRIEQAVDSTIGKQLIYDLSQQLIDPKLPHTYNQAIMDFGAIVCTPQKPKCNVCSLQKICLSYNTEWVQLLPLKTKKITIKHRWFNYYILLYKELVYIQQRTAGDIWENLYEFYKIESSEADFGKTNLLDIDTNDIISIEKVFTTKQKLTHQLIQSCFFIVKCKKIPSNIPKTRFINVNIINEYAFPKTIVSFLERKDYF